MKNSYTINYVAFVSAVEEIVEHMEVRGITDMGGVSGNN